MKCNITPIDVCQCDSDEQCKAKIEIDRLTVQLADRDTELKRQTEIVEDAEQSYFRIIDKYNSRADQILQLQTENATLREEVERLTNAATQMNDNFNKLNRMYDEMVAQRKTFGACVTPREAIAEARQEVAREILNDRLIIAYIAPDGIVHKQLLKKYGLEG